MNYCEVMRDMEKGAEEKEKDKKERSRERAMERGREIEGESETDKETERKKGRAVKMRKDEIIHIKIVYVCDTTRVKEKIPRKIKEKRSNNMREKIEKNARHILNIEILSGNCSKVRCCVSDFCLCKVCIYCACL